MASESLFQKGKPVSTEKAFLLLRAFELAVELALTFFR